MIRASEIFRNYLGAIRAIVVVDDIVRTHQQLNHLTKSKGLRYITFDVAQLCLKRVVVHGITADKHTFANKVSNKSVIRFMVKIVGIVPLLKLAIGYYADLISYCKCFVLIMGYQNRRNAIVF